MEYITVAEAAEKWGITVRQVQRLIANNRIPGVKKYEGAQIIPSDAVKPVERRSADRVPAEESMSDDLAYVIENLSPPQSRDTSDMAFDIIEDEELQIMNSIVSSYLTGDFVRAKQFFSQIEGYDALQLMACLWAIPTAISTGDYAFYLEIENWLRHIIRENIGADVTAVAQWALASGYVGSHAPHMVPDWLRDGNFAAVHPLLIPHVAYTRAKYYHCIGQNDSMLAVAQTALAFCDSRHELIPKIYLRLACAMACHSLGRLDEAKELLLETMNIYLPHGFITPFAESAQVLGGLLEQLLEQELPEYHEVVTEQWARTVKNWIAFHNQFTKGKITQMLPLQDYQIARLVARGVSYKVIADQFHVSVGTINTRMQVIYETLLISGRSRKIELAKYIL